MPKAVLLTAPIAFLLLGVSCFGGGEPQVSAEFAAAAEEAVEAALLTPDDLPPGWSSEPPAEEENDEAVFELTGECEGYEEDLPGTVARADSDELTGPDQQFLFTTAVVFPSDEMAEAAVLEIAKLYDACRQQLEDGWTESFRSLFEEGGAGAPEITVSVEDLKFEELASGLGSYRVNWSVELEERSRHGSMDFVHWRQGKVLGGLTYMIIGDENPREGRELAQLLDAKLRFVEATLPS